MFSITPMHPNQSESKNNNNSGKFLLKSYYVSGTALISIYESSHLILTITLSVDSIIIPILQMNKLKCRNINTNHVFTQLMVSNWLSWNTNQEAGSRALLFLAHSTLLYVHICLLVPSWFINKRWAKISALRVQRNIYITCIMAVFLPQSVLTKHFKCMPPPTHTALPVVAPLCRLSRKYMPAALGSSVKRGVNSSLKNSRNGQ